LQQILEPEKAFSIDEADPLQVVVFGSDDRCVGIIVDQILDIVEESIGMRRRSRPRRGLLGSGVVGKRVADFLDLQAILRVAEEDCLDANPPTPATLLLADSSAFNRGLLRNQLEMAGYRVIEAATSSEMVQRIEAESVRVLVAGFDFLSADPPAIERVRRSPGGARLRVIGLANSTGEIAERRALYPEFDDYQVRFERLAQSLDENSTFPAKRAQEVS
jgi:two-component system chemotaxis sensor kinase CheA